MREIRPSGSEGGGSELNRSSLPLSKACRSRKPRQYARGPEAAIMTDRGARVRTLRLHVIVALGSIMVLIVVNFLTTPAYPWWIYVLMAWMPLVAVHAAWALELFGGGRERRRDTEAERKR